LKQDSVVLDKSEKHLLYKKTSLR